MGKLYAKTETREEQEELRAVQRLNLLLSK